MRVLATLSTLLAAGLGAFSYWGLNTLAGQHAFDEMAGIVPFAAGIASGVFALIAVLAWWRGTRRHRASGRTMP